MNGKARPWVAPSRKRGLATALSCAVALATTNASARGYDPTHGASGMLFLLIPIALLVYALWESMWSTKSASSGWFGFAGLVLLGLILVACIEMRN